MVTWHKWITGKRQDMNTDIIVVLLVIYMLSICYLSAIDWLSVAYLVGSFSKNLDYYLQSFPYHVQNIDLMSNGNITPPYI